MAPNADKNRPFIVLAAADESNSAKPVIMAAASYVQNRNGAQLHILHVEIPLSDKGVFDDEAITTVEKENRAAGAARLRSMVAFARDECGVEAAEGHLVVGEPADVILGLAAELEAELIVTGTHDYRGLKKLLLGSVAENVARKAHCPVTLVRPVNYPEPVVPRIAAPCPACQKVQAETNQSQLWCDIHSMHHARARLHYQYPRGYAVVPDGPQ